MRGHTELEVGYRELATSLLPLAEACIWGLHDERRVLLERRKGPTWSDSEIDSANAPPSLARRCIKVAIVLMTTSATKLLGTLSYVSSFSSFPSTK